MYFNSIVFIIIKIFFIFLVFLLVSDLEIEKEAAERIAKTSDNGKVFNVLNKFKNNIEVEMSNLDKMVTDKENKWSTKVNKLNSYVKKLDNYIKENNDIINQKMN